MHPMKEFDPTKPAMVHDRLNDRTFEWKPATKQANYEKYAHAFGPDVIEWDGSCCSMAGGRSALSPRLSHRSG